MSSVFGIVKVKEVITSEDNQYPYKIICDTDGDPGAPKRFKSVNKIPIGTRIYWEYWPRDQHWVFHIMD